MDFSVVYENHLVGARLQEYLDVATHHLPTDLSENIKLVVREAIANAVQANSRAGGEHVSVTYEQCPRYIRVKVQDEGGGFEYLPQRMPPADALHGRGLAIIRRLTDYLFYLRTDRGIRMYAIWLHRG